MALLWLLVPTGIGVGLDLLRRGRALVDFQPHGKAIYFSALLVGASLWQLPLVVLARALARWRLDARARVAAIAVVIAWVFPLTTLGFGLQVAWSRFSGAWIGRDTMRLGAIVHGSLRAWLGAWATPGDAVLAMGVGLGAAAVTIAAAARAARTMPTRWPLLPFVLFPAALGVAWWDQIDSRYLQASTPDVSFVHGALHALRAATTGVGAVRQGMTLRTPDPLPPLEDRRASRPNVLVILAESLRADVTCSAPPPGCASAFLDGPAADRVALGALTAQAPNTFSASMILWTGLDPDVDIVDAHSAATIWELARAVGYRTAYVTSQDDVYEDFGVFTLRAGLDERHVATQLGGLEHEQLGAPDERALARTLEVVHAVPAGAPWLALVQLSNTHHPYEVDADLQPFQPASDEPKDLAKYRNHYKNSVRREERLVAGMLATLRADPRWDDTVVLFLSDHAEPLGQRRWIHHNHSVYDEELRVPGWLVAGSRALSAAERDALSSYAGVRTYTQDVHATVLDLLGLLDARATLPRAPHLRGRSLLRPRVEADDLVAELATSTGVWEPNDPWYGVMRDDEVVVGAPRFAWQCFDLGSDRDERRPLDLARCGHVLGEARAAWPGRVP